MKHIKKALIDTVIIGGIMMILAVFVFQKSPEKIYSILIPIAAIVCYNFIKAAIIIYNEKKNSD